VHWNLNTHPFFLKGLNISYNLGGGGNFPTNYVRKITDLAVTLIHGLRSIIWLAVLCHCLGKCESVFLCWWPSHVHIVENKVSHCAHNLYALSSTPLHHVTDCSVSNIMVCSYNWYAQLALWAWSCGFCLTRVSGLLLLGATGHQEYKSEGHLEL
jgi:hypothetical protein